MKNNFSKDELEKLYKAFWAVWEYVGGEVLECIEMTGQDEVNKSTVIETVLDANRLESFHKTDKELMKILKRFRAYPYEEQIEIAKGRFTFAMYS